MNVGLLKSSENNFIIFTKKNEALFVGDPDGTQKNIIISNKKTSLIQLDCLNNKEKNKKTKKKSENDIICDELNNKDESSVFETKNSFFETFHYPIFKEIADKFCQDDKMWYDIFYKMAKNIFCQNIKFLISSNKKENILGKLIIKNNFSSSSNANVVPVLSNKKKENNFILIEKNDDIGVIYEQIKKFLKKKLFIISEVENIKNSQISLLKDTSSFSSTKVSLSSFNKNSSNLVKNYCLIKKFLKNIKNENYYSNRVINEFKLNLDFYIRSIFFQQNLFTTETNKTIKNFYNIFWNSQKRDFEIIFMNDINLTEMFSEKNENDINSSSSYLNYSSLNKFSSYINKIYTMDIVYNFLIEKKIYSSYFEKITFSKNESFKKIVSNDFFKAYMEIFEYFIFSYNNENLLFQENNIMGEKEDNSSLISFNSTKNTFKKKIILNKFVFCNNDEERIETYKKNYKTKLIYPAITISIAILKYILTGKKLLLQILKKNYEKFLKDYKFINLFEIKESIFNINFNKEFENIELKLFDCKKNFPKNINQKEKENYLKLYSFLFKSFFCKQLKRYENT